MLVVPCLPVLPPDIVEQPGIFKKGTVMLPKIVQGLQIVKQLKRERRNVPAVREPVGIFLCKETDCINCL
jgi:hypothetical protein